MSINELAWAIVYCEATRFAAPEGDDADVIKPPIGEETIRRFLADEPGSGKSYLGDFKAFLDYEGLISTAEFDRCVPTRTNNPFTGIGFEIGAEERDLLLRLSGVWFDVHEGHPNAYVRKLLMRESGLHGLEVFIGELVFKANPMQQRDFERRIAQALSDTRSSTTGWLIPTSRDRCLACLGGHPLWTRYEVSIADSPPSQAQRVHFKRSRDGKVLLFSAISDIFLRKFDLRAIIKAMEAELGLRDHRKIGEWDKFSSMIIMSDERVRELSEQLFEACLNWDDVGMAVALARGADINYVGQNGATVLHLAAHKNVNSALALILQDEDVGPWLPESHPAYGEFGGKQALLYKVAAAVANLDPLTRSVEGRLPSETMFMRYGYGLGDQMSDEHLSRVLNVEQAAAEARGLDYFKIARGPAGVDVNPNPHKTDQPSPPEP